MTFRTRLVTCALALLVLAASIAPAAAAGAAPKKPRIGDPFSPATIAKLLLEKSAGVAANKGVNFLFTQLGLNQIIGGSPDEQALADIKRQLDPISTQITRVQESIDSLARDVRQAHLDFKLDLLSTKTSTNESVFRNYFLPMLGKATDLAKARETNDPDKINAALEQMAKQRDSFYAQFDAHVAGTDQFIHGYLTPGASTSVLAAKGSLVLAGERYLTREDSLDIREMYNAVADQEALASLMTMERWLPTVGRDPVAPISAGNIDNFNGERELYLQRRTKEFVNLPPMIPADAVVDAGATPRNETDNAAMFTPVGKDLRYKPDGAGLGTVPGALGDLNLEMRGAFDDWAVPAQSAVTGLLAGFAPATGKTPNKYLSALNDDSDEWKAITRDAWPFVWSKDTVTQATLCFWAMPDAPTYRMTVSTHTGVSTDTPAAVWGGRPKFQSDLNANLNNQKNTCEAYATTLFASNAALGGFLASRSTGAMPIDYAAQGNGPNIKRNADLRGADLTGFYLPGVDMRGTDLRKATLVGVTLDDAELSGAKLSGVVSSGIVGTPKSLPTGWHLINGRLFGPGVDLTGANLAKADLSDLDLRGVKSGAVDCTGCTLPDGWTWTGLPSGYLVGPGADLRGADLSGLDLSGANLTGADLTGADLRKSSLVGLTAPGANFTSAVMNTVDLTGANLNNAHLPRVTLSGSKLVGVNLAGADFQKANIRIVDFTDADLRQANLSGVDAAAALLTRTRLAGADITGAYLSTRGVRMTSGGLVGVPKELPNNFRVVQGYLVGPDADLSNADFTGANLSTAILVRAVLRSAKLLNANLTNANLAGAILTGANVGDATMSNNDDKNYAGVVSGLLANRPKTLPNARFRIVSTYLVGPGTNVTGARFTSGVQLGTALNGMNFSNTVLTGVNLTNANLTGANLTGARLTNTSLTGATLAGANLTSVISGGIVGGPTLPSPWKIAKGYLLGPDANLVGAILPGTDMIGFDLTGADLANANMSGVNFTRTNLTRANLNGTNLIAATWSDTICPNGTRQSTPCTPLPRTAASVAVAADTAENLLLVDVDPDLGNDSWSVQLQQQLANGEWVSAGAFVTSGSRETLKLNLTAGTYRVVVPSQNGYLGATSDEIALLK